MRVLCNAFYLKKGMYMNLSKMYKSLLALMLAIMMIVPAVPAYADNVAAATRPEDADLITYTEVYTGSFVEGSSNTVHYYKFKTRPQKVSYTLMARLVYEKDDNTGMDVEILDSNLNVVLPDGVDVYGTSAKIYLWDDIGDAGSKTYSSLKTSSYYYIRVTDGQSSINDTDITYAIGLSSPYASTPNVVGGKAISLNTRQSGEFPQKTATKYHYFKITTPQSTQNKQYVLTAKYTKCSGDVSSALEFKLFDRNLNLVLPDGTDSNSVSTEKWIFLNKPGASYSRTYSSLKPGTPYYVAVSNSDTFFGTNSYSFKVTEKEVRYLDAVYTVVRSGSTYNIRHSGKTGAVTVTLSKAANKKKVTIPAKIKDDKGVTRTVKGIEPKAFKASKANTVIVKTKAFTKASVRNSLKGSKVKLIKVKVSSKKKTNNKYVKNYKKYFKKSNSGKKVTVKL